MFWLFLDQTERTSQMFNLVDDVANSRVEFTFCLILDRTKRLIRRADVGHEHVGVGGNRTHWRDARAPIRSPGARLRLRLR